MFTIIQVKKATNQLTVSHCLFCIQHQTRALQSLRDKELAAGCLSCDDMMITRSMVKKRKIDDVKQEQKQEQQEEKQKRPRNVVFNDDALTTDCILPPVLTADATKEELLAFQEANNAELNDMIERNYAERNAEDIQAEKEGKPLHEVWNSPEVSRNIINIW